MPENDGGPAFPWSARMISSGSIEALTTGGMSLRDWFAGQALAGLLASGKWDNSGDGFEAFIATHAFNIADAMLAARENDNG